MCEYCWGYSDDDEYSSHDWWVLEVFSDGRESFSKKPHLFTSAGDSIKGDWHYDIYDRHAPKKLVLESPDPEWINRWYDYRTRVYRQLVEREDVEVCGLTVPVRYIQGAPTLHRVRPTHTWYHVDQLTHEFLERQRDGFRIA